MLSRESGPASRAVETVVITARLSGALATKLVQRSLAGQGVSIVWVDSASFAGRPTKVEPELLRLQAAGVAVAVVRRGDSLAAVLGAAPVVSERAWLGRSASTSSRRLLITLGWLRLEETHAAGADWLWVVLLALVPALAPTVWLRLALVAPAALIAAWVALDTPAIDDRPGFFGPVLDRFANGVGGFYDVTVPFNALEHQRMHGVVLLAIFGFCVVLAQAIAARRPLLALLVVIARRRLARRALSLAQHRLRRRHPGRRAVGPRRPALRAAPFPRSSPALRS